MKYIECRNCGAEPAYTVQGYCMVCAAENLPVLEREEVQTLDAAVQQVAGPRPPAEIRRALARALRRIADELEAAAKR